MCPCTYYILYNFWPFSALIWALGLKKICETSGNFIGNLAFKISYQICPFCWILLAPLDNWQIGHFGPLDILRLMHLHSILFTLPTPMPTLSGFRVKIGKWKKGQPSKVNNVVNILQPNLFMIFPLRFEQKKIKFP
jgi:hypothetical protein